MLKINVLSGSKLYTLFLLCLSFICITITYYVINTKNFSIKTEYLAAIFTGGINEANDLADEINDFENNGTSLDQLIVEHCPVAENKIGYTCLEQLQRFKIVNKRYKSEQSIVYYHTFWKLDDGKPHHLRVMILKIYSYLATQDLTKTKLVLWVQNEFNSNVNKTLTDKFGYYLKQNVINVWILNFTDLCSIGIFKQKFENCARTQNGNSVAFSDFIRFLVLYKYGGIYTDGDVFFLRDMRPFWKKNFVHRWSFTPDYNTAIMGLLLNRTAAIEKIYDAIVGSGHDLVGGFYPARVKDTIFHLNKGFIYNYTDFEVYHSILFDPAWLCNDGILPRLDQKIVCIFKEFYDTQITAEEFDINKFYGGAFSFHLHLGNCGSCQITPTSYFYHVENYFIKKIDKLGDVQNK